MKKKFKEGINDGNFFAPAKTTLKNKEYTCDVVVEAWTDVVSLSVGDGTVDLPTELVKQITKTLLKMAKLSKAAAEGEN